MTITLSNPRYAAALGDQFTVGGGVRQISGTFADTSSRTLAVGTAAGQVVADPSITVTVAVPPQGQTAAAVVIDLTNLTDDSGRVFSLTAVEALKVTNQSTTVGQDVTVGGGSTPLLPAMPVLVGGTRGDATLLLATPLTVDANHKLLQLSAPAGGTVLVSMLAR